MKALTVWQPWASLIMLGAKPFEFRKWAYTARDKKLLGQRIVIHAGARAVLVKDVREILERLDAGESSLVESIARPLCERLLSVYRCEGVLELSAGLGTAVLGKPRPVGELFGGKGHDSTRLNHHLYAWPLTDIQPFAHPVPCRGAQGFWTWPDNLGVAA